MHKLIAYVRSVLALKLKPYIAGRANERMYSGKPDPVQNSAQGKTRDELASIANVSHDTIAKVEVIEAYADDETKESLKTGEISINKAYGDIIREQKRAEIVGALEDIKIAKQKKRWANTT